MQRRRVSLATWTLLAAVVSRLSLAAGQSNSSCGIDATPGIRFTGQVWPDWTASKGASADAWSMAGIPAESQAWQADSAQECNCLCTRVTNCVGYTWLGGDVKRCWLMSFVLWWANPSPEYVDPSLPFSENLGFVPVDTVVGRVVNGSWPVCSDGIYALQDQQLTSMTWHSINRTVVGPFYENVATQCNAACGQAPGCVAFTWQQNLTDVAVSSASSAASVMSGQAAATGSTLVAGDGTDLGSQPAMCVLYSEVQGPLFPYQPNNNATVYLAPFQACDMGPNAPASPPPSPQPSPPAPSPSVPASPAPVAQPSPAPSPAPSPPLGAPQVLPGLLTLAAAALAAVMLLQSM